MCSGSWAPAISRAECMESMGLPTSTVGMPSSAAVIGPMVQPINPIETLVDDKHAFELEVEFDPGHTQLQGLLERKDCILGVLGGKTAMGDVQHGS